MAGSAPARQAKGYPAHLYLERPETETIVGIGERTVGVRPIWAALSSSTAARPRPVTRATRPTRPGELGRPAHAAGRFLAAAGPLLRADLRAFQRQ
jgi:hypothetical protein